MRALIPLLFLLLPLSVAGADLDKDGLDDALEARLLQQFRPRFLASPADCGGLPAAIRPSLPDPEVVPNAPATIYGQAFPTGPDIELHYYHLWARDCGRLSHQWDVEHVAVLTRNGRARFWFASAHQDTVCDAGHGARAATLHAEDRGATVWISHGKHASFLSEKNCRLGCGGDRCQNASPLPYGDVINLGEPGAPLNGALWIASRKWPLAQKMGSAFPPAVLTQIDAKGVRSLDPTRLPVQSVILGGNTAIGGLERAQSETGDALSVSKGKVKRALRRARDWVGAKVN